MKFFVSFLLCLFSLSFLKAQKSQYLFERKTGESADAFVERYLEAYHESSTMIHQVIEGSWGDATKGKKIMAFYNVAMVEEYDQATMVVFQPVGDGKQYVMILSNLIGRVGTYYQGIESVFFMDLNKDGAKELLLIERGENRATVTLEQEDENGNMVEYETTACCEDEYILTMIEQITDQNGNFLPSFREFEIPENWDLGVFKTASEVKKQLEKYQH